MKTGIGRQVCQGQEGQQTADILSLLPVLISQPSAQMGLLGPTPAIMLDQSPSGPGKALRKEMSNTSPYDVDLPT